MCDQKNFQPNQSSRLAGYTHIYTNVLFYYIDWRGSEENSNKKFKKRFKQTKRLN